MFRSNWNGKPQGCANPSEAFCPEPCRIGTVIAAAFEARRAHAETPPRFSSMSSIIPREAGNEERVGALSATTAGSYADARRTSGRPTGNTRPSDRTAA